MKTIETITLREILEALKQRKEGVELERKRQIVAANLALSDPVPDNYREVVVRAINDQHLALLNKLDMVDQWIMTLVMYDIPRKV